MVAARCAFVPGVADEGLQTAGRGDRPRFGDHGPALRVTVVADPMLGPALGDPTLRIRKQGIHTDRRLPVPNQPDHLVHECTLPSMGGPYQVDPATNCVGKARPSLTLRALRSYDDDLLA